MPRSLEGKDMKQLLITLCIATLLWLSFASHSAYAYGETYIVQPGDTLFAIAARYGLNVNDLAAANGINNGYWVYPGQQLIIPTAPPFPNPPAWAERANPAIEPRFVNFTSPPAAGNYTVQPGDTLYNIADHFGVAIIDLQAANNLSTFGQAIYAGQRLIIPRDAMASPIESFLNRPALHAPPAWTEVDAPPQPWRPFAMQSPPLYGSGPLQPYSARPNPASERWIDVDLTRQSLIAYEGQRPVFRTRISSGLPQFPTVVGTFSIYVKYEMADMAGGAGDDEYFLPAVPYVMYFQGNYGLHGTYWHHNFGQPMSHGCVNMFTPDAQWLFNWAPVGAKVVTHY
jgi:LysM repeat protein